MHSRIARKKSVIVNNLYPPEWYRNNNVVNTPFEKVVIWYATLHIPVGSKRVYTEAAADTWGQFFNIVDDITGIKKVTTMENDSHSTQNNYYDLQGRPVNNPVKGQIYIVNGKKALAKQV